MRILFTVIPEKTTFLHMVPLAWALRTAGHDVRVACAPGFTDTVTQAGLTAVPVGRDASAWRVDGLDPELLQEARVGLPPPWNVVVDPDHTSWEELEEGHRIAVAEGHKPENFPIIAGVVDFARHWQPDLVVWEPLSYVGAIAAKACGAAHARMAWSIDVLGLTRHHYRKRLAALPADQRSDPLADWLAGYGRKYGFTFSEDMAVGHFTIDQMPPSLRMTADELHYVPIQYVPYGGPCVIPPWLQDADRPTRPRIALTLGTTAAERFASYSVSVQDVLDALADPAVEVVATIAAAQQQKLTRVPDNTRVAAYVPLDALAPTCSVMINHAGPGTFLTIGRHGIPQLTVPSDFDEPELGRRAAARGGSLTIPPGEVTVAGLRDGVARLLDEHAFTRDAATLRDEILDLPTPSELVGPLEELTVKYRTR